MSLKPALRIAVVMVAAAGPAQAIEFNQVGPAKSRLDFVTRQMGVPVDGSFRKFATQLRFDPAKPNEAKAEIEIDLASIDAGSKDANDEVVGKAWFNTKQFPTAKFVSASVRPLGNNRFEVAGKMTIKGRTQNTVAPFTFKQDANRGYFDGAFTLKRADFGIGEGVWADYGTVANEIQIKFHFEAAEGAARK